MYLVGASAKSETDGVSFFVAGWMREENGLRTTRKFSKSPHRVHTKHVCGVLFETKHPPAGSGVSTSGKRERGPQS